MANILVVDDEKSIRITFKAFLSKENHTVSLADSASHAFDIIDSNDIDLIITDIVMSEISGIEILDMVNEKHPDLPVILMSGEPNLTTAKKAIQGGAVDLFIQTSIKR